MNIHEYQAKQLLAQHGVAVPDEQPCTTVEEAHAAAETLFTGGAQAAVVKSQIHAGGRGKGTFKSGFQGGVKIAKSVDEAVSHARNMLGNVLVTKQTGPDGRRVSTILVGSALKIKREFYLAVLLDRANSRPLIMASTEGGVDIEEVPPKPRKESSRNGLTPLLASCRTRRAKSPPRSD
jgi:succinyl-CoA synthetase beta subunit